MKTEDHSHHSTNAGGFATHTNITEERRPSHTAELQISARQSQTPIHVHVPSNSTPPHIDSPQMVGSSGPWPARITSLYNAAYSNSYSVHPQNRTAAVVDLGSLEAVSESSDYKQTKATFVVSWLQLAGYGLSGNCRWYSALVLVVVMAAQSAVYYTAARAICTWPRARGSFRRTSLRSTSTVT